MAKTMPFAKNAFVHHLLLLVLLIIVIVIAYIYMPRVSEPFNDFVSMCDNCYTVQGYFDAHKEECLACQPTHSNQPDGL